MLRLVRALAIQELKAGKGGLGEQAARAWIRGLIVTKRNDLVEEREAIVRGENVLHVGHLTKNITVIRSSVSDVDQRMVKFNSQSMSMTYRNH